MGEEEKFLESASPCRPVGGAAKNEDDLVFPGFRFHPTDQELVEFYLTRKVEKKGFSIEIIREIDIYKHDPWDLPKWSHAQQQEGLGLGSGGETTTECYFFCLRGRKYRNSIRPNRVTGSGFWKATGIDKPIYSGTAAAAAACIGLKKSLVYYRGSAGKGTKTDWMMHEFRLPSSSSSPSPAESQDAEIWTICRIFKRSISYSKRCQQKQKQQQDQHGNKRSHHYQQLDYYNRHHYTAWSAAPMAASGFQLNAGRTSHAAAAHQQPFLLTGFYGTPSAAAPPPGWSETTSFRVDGGGSSWDELGRIMEISTDSSYL